MSITAVKYAWLGTVILTMYIIYIEVKCWLVARREKRLTKLHNLEAAMVVTSGTMLATAVTAWADGGSAMVWLHPDIIDRIERFIMTVGFSVFTALWFMFRAETRLDKNNELQSEQISLLKKLLGEKE